MWFPRYYPALILFRFCILFADLEPQFFFNKTKIFDAEVLLSLLYNRLLYCGVLMPRCWRNPVGSWIVYLKMYSWSLGSDFTNWSSNREIWCLNPLFINVKKTPPFFFYSSIAYPILFSILTNSEPYIYSLIRSMKLGVVYLSFSTPKSYGWSIVKLYQYLS